MPRQRQKSTKKTRNKTHHKYLAHVTPGRTISQFCGFVNSGRCTRWNGSTEKTVFGSHINLDLDKGWGLLRIRIEREEIQRYRKVYERI
jgi:hypothetical protein